MSEPNRLDFLVFYRKQLQIICDKIDKQIEKERNVQPKEEVKEAYKDLTDPKFVLEYASHPGVIEAFNTCREYMQSISEKERADDGRLFYDSSRLGGRFGMVAISPKHMHLYITPRLGLYDNLPPEAWHELRFGKSQGDRWDKFQLTSKRQANMAVSYLKGFLETSEDGDAKVTEEDSAA
jgi:hypothetical protein